MHLTLNDVQLVGGLVGDALDASANAIKEGIFEGFKLVLGTSAIVIEKVAEFSIYGCVFMYFAGKDKKLKGSLIKYAIIYGGALYIEKIVKSL